MCNHIRHCYNLIQSFQAPVYPLKPRQVKAARPALEVNADFTEPLLLQSKAAVTWMSAGLRKRSIQQSLQEFSLNFRAWTFHFVSAEFCAFLSTLPCPSRTFCQSPLLLVTSAIFAGRWKKRWWSCLPFITSGKYPAITYTLAKAWKIPERANRGCLLQDHGQLHSV